MQTLWIQIRLLLQEQFDLGPQCLSMKLQFFIGRQKHTFCDYALLVLINVSSVCIRLGFHEMHARLRGPKKLII